MIGRSTIGLLAGALALAVAGGALADNLGFVGDANTSPFGVQQGGLVHGPVTWTSSNDYGSATSSLSLDAPGGLVSSAANATKLGTSYGINELDYTFQIHAINGAPTNFAVPLGVTATGYADASGAGGSSYVEFFIGEFYDHVGSSERFEPGPQTYTYDHGPIMVGVDTDIAVRMIANSYAYGGNSDCVTDCDATAEAWLDPIFTLLGPNAADYIIVGVPGPGAVPPTSGVPEPASWALMIAGFGLAGASLRRRQASVAIA